MIMNSRSKAKAGCAEGSKCLACDQEARMKAKKTIGARDDILIANRHLVEATASDGTLPGEEKAAADACASPC